jgi:hypothetical protein
MKFLVICSLSVSVCASSQQQKTPPVAVAPDCLEFSLEGRVNGGEEYSHELGGGLRIRLLPSKENWGWMVQVQPLDSTDDYAYPVNPPFGSGNSQWLSTGYGETVEQQLKYEHEVYFVLNRAEYEHAAKLVEHSLSSSAPSAPGIFLSTLPTLRSAVLRIKPTKYETTNAGKSVNWMQFSMTVDDPCQPRTRVGPQRKTNRLSLEPSLTVTARDLLDSDKSLVGLRNIFGSQILTPVMSRYQTCAVPELRMSD